MTEHVVCRIELCEWAPSCPDRFSFSDITGVPRCTFCRDDGTRLVEETQVVYDNYRRLTTYVGGHIAIVDDPVWRPVVPEEGEGN